MNLPSRHLPHSFGPTKTLLVVEDDRATLSLYRACPLYTSDAADE